MTEIVCPSCFAINRVPEDRIGQQPKCGKCGVLLQQNLPVDLDAAHFDRFITRNGLPVLVDFWANWCGPCKMMAPAFKQTAAELAAKVSFAKVETEAEQALAARYAIRSIPTLILFRHGKEIARMSGALDAPGIKRWLNAQGL
ncbi:MAG: thioredoxin TrxC [Burkholderiales bacterium]